MPHFSVLPASTRKSTAPSSQKVASLRLTAARRTLATASRSTELDSKLTPQLAARTTKALPVFRGCLDSVQLIGKGVLNCELQSLLHAAKGGLTLLRQD